MKRSSMKRSGGNLDRSSAIKPRSDKRAKFMREVRAPLVKRLRDEGHPCEIGQMLADVGHDRVRHCQREVQGLHERRKRSAGGSLIKPENLVPACNLCNGWIEEATGEDRELLLELGLIVRAGDPEWDELGKAGDEENVDG